MPVCLFVSLFQINTTDDEIDKTNPFRFANIGVEKFLELNSEQNHDEYCLAYVFTDRDFDDGVLGLAWVGAPSGTIREKQRVSSVYLLIGSKVCVYLFFYSIFYRPVTNLTLGIKKGKQ